MANLIKSEGRTMYGIEEWIADSVEELKNNRLSVKTERHFFCTKKLS